MQLRIAWGGGAERTWRGRIQLSEGTLSDPRALGVEADEPGSMWIEQGRLEIASKGPRAYDGVDLQLNAPLEARLQIALWPDDAGAPETPVEVPLASLVSDYHNSLLDDRENHLLVRRAPGDQLRVRLEPNRTSLVFAPGELLRLELLPRLLNTGSNKVKFDMQLHGAKGGASVWSEERELTVDDGAPPSVPIEIKLPTIEGVYDLLLSARIRNRLKLWESKNLAERKVQIVVVDPNAPPAPLEGERPLVKLAEIDPTVPLNPAWWNRFATLAVLPGFRNKEALGTGEAAPWQHPQLREKLVQLGSGGREPNISWEAYPLPIEKPGEPHVLEIDYPSDVPQSLGISIVEPNAAGAVLPVGLDSGVYVSDEAAQDTPRLEKHRLIFYPRTKSPLVLLTNRRDGTPAVYGRLRLFGGQGRLPRALARERVAGRLWAGYIDQPLFPENFSAPDSLDNWSGRSLDDWSTFYEGAMRTADYLNHVGQNGLMLSVLAEGSTLYPSRLIEPTPRHDTGLFFGTGQDPVRKDVLELLLRIFDRERLALVPLVQFSAPLPQLEEILRRGGPESIGIECVGPEGLTWRQENPALRKGPCYNPFDPRVQDAMLNVLRELISHCGEHPSFKGVALDLTADGYAILPDSSWGLDDGTIAAFQRAHPQLRIPGDGATRFAERARYLTGEQRPAWVAWRAAQIQQFYRKVQAELAAANPRWLLYLASANMFASAASQQTLRPQLARKSRMEQLLQELGVRADGGNDSGIVFLRPQRIAPLSDLEAQSVNLEINQTLELDTLAASQNVPAALFYHVPQEARLESFDAKSPFKRTYTWLSSQSMPSGQENRRRFVRALAAYDAQQMFDGGLMLPLGQEAASAALMAAYCRLPAERFETLADCPQPIMARTLARGDETWFYAVNDSPWSVTVSLPIKAPPGCRLEPLDERRSTPQLAQDSRGATIRVQLEPYDMAGGCLKAPRVTFLRASVELPPNAVESLAARMKDLGNRQLALGYPKPLESWPLNRGFEEPPTGDSEIPGWSAPGRTAQIDLHEKHTGSQSVRLLRSPGDRESWLRSDVIAAPTTGRLAISAWLRVADPRRQPAIRLAAEWQAEGRNQYRYAALGQSQFGEKEEPIPNQWKWYIFSVNDLPADVSQLRVRIDLMGEGAVWIDDVQLYDLLFDQRTERIELIKMIWHYTDRLQAGQVGECLQFLDSYWPRFLTAHVPLVNRPSPVTPPPPRTASQPKPAVPPEERKPGFLDRLKEYVPRRSWF